MIKSIFIACLTVTSCFVHAQSNSWSTYPKVGKMCPDFKLKNIKYFVKRSASLNDFHGKWLILDFWNKYCSACLASFPKISSLQLEFGEKVQFMMVGIEDPEQQIESLYLKYKIKEKLIMPCSFDSSLAKQWGIYAAPHIIVIDDKGIVQGITNSIYADQINVFLNGGHPDLIPVAGDEVDNTKIPFVVDKPFLMYGNGGIDSEFLFRSILSKISLSRQQQFVPRNVYESIKDGKFQVLGVPLFWLFNYSHFGVCRPGGYARDSTYGKFQNFPILEICDSSLFKYSFSHDSNLFAYSLVIPHIDIFSGNILNIMQGDLQHYFGYEANIEVRKCKCWKLILKKGARDKLISKTSKATYILTKSGFKASNWPYKNLIDMIFYGFQNEVIFDETGITENIDIVINDDVWTTIQDAQKALRLCGFDLMAIEKEMKVLVIRDSHKKN